MHSSFARSRKRIRPTRQSPPMTVYKLIEVVGTSGTSIDDAIHGAIERTSATVQDIRWFEVKEIRGRIDEQKLPEFQVRLDIGFVVHAPQDLEKLNAERHGRKAGSRQARSAAAQLVAKKGGRKRSDLANGFRKERAK